MFGWLFGFGFLFGSFVISLMIGLMREWLNVCGVMWWNLLM